MLYDLKIKDFNDVLASSKPAPGGGSSAALAGVMGSALSLMVIELSTCKRAYEELDEVIKEQIKLDHQILSAINKELLELFHEDTEAFNQVMQALKLPQQSEAERQNRLERMRAANRRALQVPLLVAEKCCDTLKHQINIARYGNRNAVSDVGVGALLAYAGLQGAVLNVQINLPGIKEQDLSKQAAAKCQELLAEAADIKSQIMNIVNQRLHC